MDHIKCDPNFGTKAFDYSFEKNFQNEIAILRKRRTNASEELRKHLDQIQNHANKFYELGLNKEESAVAAFMAIKNGYHNFNKAKKFVKNATKNFSSFGMRNAGNISNCIGVGSIQLVTMLNKLGINASKKNDVNIKISNKVEVELLVIIDIYSLIDQWKSHPTATAVQDIINKITDEVEPLRMMKEELLID